ncbi:MAG: ribbon-helix-helix protein, CopG family [Acidimicrobiia bacterium]|nr:ribbon-helix-helix protein, CopG family [Acidimicrobiia bacterium]
MPRKQVLVQLDDDLVERLDRLADSMEVSRSELLRRGALAVLEAARIEEAERVAVEAYRRLPEDPVWVATASRLAAEMTPEW